MIISWVLRGIITISAKSASLIAASSVRNSFLQQRLQTRLRLFEGDALLVNVLEIILQHVERHGYTRNEIPNFQLSHLVILRIMSILIEESLQNRPLMITKCYKIESSN